jgi:hypothetical protein
MIVIAILVLIAGLLMKRAGMSPRPHNARVPLSAVPRG